MRTVRAGRWTQPSEAPEAPRSRRASDAVSRLLILIRRGLTRAFPFLQRALVFLVGVVVPTDPRQAHLVDRAVSAADPIARVRIDLVRRVVVPTDHVQHRA